MGKGILDRVAGSADSTSEPGGDGSDRSTQIVNGGLVTLGGQTACTLDFRFRSGTRQAFPYSYLATVKIDPSVAIVCRFAAATVTIKGRNLSAAYNAISTQTATAIVESESRFDEGKEAVFVESILIEEDGAQK